MLEGAINGEIFKLYVDQVLGPTLRPGDILIMDNLSSHKVEGVDQLVAARGARVEYLSSYSPDDNRLSAAGQSSRLMCDAQKRELTTRWCKRSKKPWRASRNLMLANGLNSAVIP